VPIVYAVTSVEVLTEVPRNPRAKVTLRFTYTAPNSVGIGGADPQVAGQHACTPDRIAPTGVYQLYPAGTGSGETTIAVSCHVDAVIIYMNAPGGRLAFEFPVSLDP
jgi:hypothetical protein